MEEVVLEALDLSMHYGKKKVLKSISLKVEAGAVVGLLGPNGAGKTTSFYLIVGTLRPDGGKIFLKGKEITHLPVHRRAALGLSYLPQENSVFRQLSVEDNIRAILELRRENGKKLSKKVLEERLEGLIEDLHVGGIRHQLGRVLSGGERRRTEIARALATNPAVVLLDEPFAGIDPIAVGEIQKIISFLKERGIGVLITDHNVRETLGSCDHAYIVNDGRILAAGTPAEIVADPQVRRVYLGESFVL